MRVFSNYFSFILPGHYATATATTTTRWILSTIITNNQINIIKKVCHCGNTQTLNDDTLSSINLLDSKTHTFTHTIDVLFFFFTSRSIQFGLFCMCVCVWLDASCIQERNRQFIYSAIEKNEKNEKKAVWTTNYRYKPTLKQKK